MTDVSYGVVLDVQKYQRLDIISLQAKKQMKQHGSARHVTTSNVAVVEDKSIEDRCCEYTENINQRLKTLETNIHKKNREIRDDKQEGRTWQA